MLTRATSNPRAARIAVACSVVAIALLAFSVVLADTAAAQARKVKVEGTIGKTTLDPLDGSHVDRRTNSPLVLQGARRMYKLVVRNGKTRVLKGKRRYRWTRGSKLIADDTRVIVRGTLKNGTLRATTVRISPKLRAQSSVAGAFKTVVIPYNFSNDRSTPYTQSQLRTEVFTGASSANAFWKDVSGDTVSFTGKLPGSTDGDVLANWVEIANTNADCTSNYVAWGSAALAASGIDANDYDRIVYVSPVPPGCSYGGVAVGSK